ncbi:MAG TPA: hypothetical protein PKB03_01425 [Baekduia sp.]|nr:hypothetical protein [Baekduia sp.]
MSFLIDGPWLYANGRAIAELPKEAQQPVAAATIGTFLVTSISLYANARWTNWIARMCRARSGRDWMVNSGVLRIDETKIGRRGHIISAGIFATYPLWLWLGMRDGRRR